MLFKVRTNISKNKLLTLLVLLISVFSSCLSRKQTDYFQVKKDDAKTMDVLPMTSLSDPVIKPYDLINIQVSSVNPEAARFFNPVPETDSEATGVPTSYMVDSLGEIEMPVIGKIKVSGMTTRVIRDTLRTRLEKFLQNPTLQVYFASFNVTLLGEVKMPGMYNSKTEKLSITDALGMAGDLTIYGDRKKVMLIRESEGKKHLTNIDLTTRNVFTSAEYYLRPGDVIYVPAGKGRIASADAFYRIAPLVISTLTLISLLMYRNSLN